jgi:hypothetical protein
VIYSHSDFDRDPFLAAEDISSFLHRGSLMLFLGSGVWSGFGLPSWPRLVARVVDKGDDEEFVQRLAGETDKVLAKLIDDVDDGSKEYIEKIHNALYSGVLEDLTERLSQSPLLLAVAALLTGSCRGRISTIITYNYDDLLKQYLQMLGYSVCIRKGPSDTSTWADVEINHVHGYLPQSREGESNASELVFSEKSYRQRRALIDEGWSSYVEHCLYSKIGLFLGLSGDDSSILDIFKRASGKIKRPEDYTGYWLMTPEAYERNAKSIIDVGMCPIKLIKEKFPRFVFDVCQRAIGE